MTDQRTSDVAIGDHGGSISDLGVLTDRDGDALVGTVEVVNEMFLPGTRIVRPSVLVTVADVVAGKFANTMFTPRVCVTLDLDLHVVRNPVGEGFGPGGVFACRSWVVRGGRRIIVMGFELTTDDGYRFAFGHAGFMASPNPDHIVPGGFPLVSTERRRRLGRPFAERAGVRRTSDGRAELPDAIDNVNATGALQGGLLALCAEEALLARQPTAVPASMSIRYLRGFRQTAAFADAEIHGDVARIEVVDSGGEVGAVVVTRSGHRQ